MARAELLLALGAGAPPPGDPDGSVPMLMSTRAYLTREEIHDFTQALGQVIEKYMTLEKRPGATEFHAVFALYRSNVRPADAS